MHCFSTNKNVDTIGILEMNASRELLFLLIKHMKNTWIGKVIKTNQKSRKQKATMEKMSECVMNSSSKQKTVYFLVLFYILV